MTIDNTAGQPAPPTASTDDRRPNDHPGHMVATYTGHLPRDIYIAEQTNPWIEIDNVAVCWSVARLVPDPANECETCTGEPVPGVLTDDEVGVQRCDTCVRFDGDLSAALALAALVGGVVKYEQEPATDRPAAAIDQPQPKGEPDAVPGEPVR